MCALPGSRPPRCLCLELTALPCRRAAACLPALPCQELATLHILLLYSVPFKAHYGRVLLCFYPHLGGEARRLGAGRSPLGSVLALMAMPCLAPTRQAPLLRSPSHSPCPSPPLPPSPARRPALGKRHAVTKALDRLTVQVFHLEVGGLRAGGGGVQAGFVPCSLTPAQRPPLTVLPAVGGEGPAGMAIIIGAPLCGWLHEVTLWSQQRAAPPATVWARTASCTTCLPPSLPPSGDVPGAGRARQPARGAAALAAQRAAAGGGREWAPERRQPAAGRWGDGVGGQCWAGKRFQAGGTGGAYWIHCATINRATLHAAPAGIWAGTSWCAASRQASTPACLPACLWAPPPLPADRQYLRIAADLHMCLSHSGVVLQLLGGPQGHLFGPSFLQVFRVMQGACPVRCGWVCCGRGGGGHRRAGAWHRLCVWSAWVAQSVQAALPRVA